MYDKYFTEYLQNGKIDMKKIEQYDMLLDVGTTITSELEKRSISVEDLARNLELSNAEILSILIAEDYKISSLFKVCNYLKIDLGVAVIPSVYDSCVIIDELVLPEEGLSI